MGIKRVHHNTLDIMKAKGRERSAQLSEKKKEKHDNEKQGKRKGGKCKLQRVTNHVFPSRGVEKLYNFISVEKEEILLLDIH